MLPNDILSKKVLIIDDMVTIREALLHHLMSLGFSYISQAEDGYQAWRLIKEANFGKPYELIFSDIVMPNCTGIEFLKLLRCTEGYEKTPAIMVTSENEISTILEAVSAGASNYLLKPFDQKSIEQKILEVFKKKQAAQR